jgi:hypothetical protein
VRSRIAAKPIRGAEALVGAYLLLPAVTLLGFVISRYWWGGIPETTAMLAAARTIGGGIASPAASIVLLLAATYVPVIWSLRRLGALGYGYGRLARSSKAFVRLLGLEGVASLTSLLDAPARHMPRWSLLAIAAVLSVVARLLLPNVASVEGMTHTVFLGTASIIGLAAALVLMAQSLEIWRRLRGLLLTMAELPLGAALTRLGMPRLTWNISIVPPDTRDLRVSVRLAAELRDRIEDPRVAALLGPASKAALDEVLKKDILERQRGAIPLTQSITWLRLWKLCDTLLPPVESCRWNRCGDRNSQSPACDTRPSPVASCLDCCETLLAATRALVLRDVTARIMSGVFAGMLILGLLAAAHLLYVFQGRASFLVLDMMALGLASVAAVWILLGMERDAILSLIWRTTPGRVTFNWALIQRLIVYGALPLIIVLGSMFPEVGEKLVRVIDPLRRLTVM